MRQFAEEEIRLPPGGPHGNKPFRCARQPYTGLLLALLDDPTWTRAALCGPTQSGKTLAAFIIPTLYALFELRERVVCGIPNLEMAGDKWREDILPVIMASRYRNLLPLTGTGSRSGGAGFSRGAIQFRNGASLRFMAGGGGDKQRAAYTARFTITTEVNDLDKIGGKSDEADKQTQIEGRSRSFGSRARNIMECTPTTEEGRITREIRAGTNTRIAMPCTHCGEYVTPGRQHIVGWQDAATELEARDAASWACPACAQTWTEQQRHQSALASVAVHEGQTVGRDGVVRGEPKRTRTLGFQWSAADNFFTAPGDIAIDLWRHANLQAQGLEHQASIENRKLQQFIFAEPSDDPSVAEDKLDRAVLLSRVGDNPPQNALPDDTTHLAIGADVGKRQIHWVLGAGTARRSVVLVGYGITEVAGDDMPLDTAIPAALAEIRETVRDLPTFHAGELWAPDAAVVDAGFEADAVYAAVRRFNAEHRSDPASQPTGWYAAKGVESTKYRQPKRNTPSVRMIGEGWHMDTLPNRRGFLVLHDVDSAKADIHQRLTVPVEQDGSVSFFTPARKRQHVRLVSHLTAEHRRDEFKEGRGWKTRYYVDSRDNHFLDATVLMRLGLLIKGFRFDPKSEPVNTPRPHRRATRPVSRPGGRGFLPGR